MSIQICKIRGYGYKFDYKDNLFSFITDMDEEYNFLNVINLNYDYYSLRDYKQTEKPLLAVIIDGMGGEYKYVMFVIDAHYVDNTHSEYPWHINCRFDDFVKERTKTKIETLLRRELDEPEIYEFTHYS